MLPEVQAWATAREEADQTYNHLRDAKRTATREELAALDRNAADYHEQRYQVDERLYRALDALSQTRGEAYDAANEKLRADASLPIITWLLDNAYEEYPDHVQMVLEALPLARAELVALARSNQWCNVFDGFLRQMDRAQLFGPRDPQELAQEELDQYLSGNLYHRDADRVRELVGRVVDAALAKRAAEASGRVDTAWDFLKGVSPAVVDLQSAETLFRKAAQFVATGEDPDIKS